MNSSNEKLDKYQEWLKQINNEALNLSYTQLVWNKLTTIQNNSEHFKKTGGHLQNWIHNNYVCHLVMLISRICDPNGKRQSDRNLTKFLKEIKKNHYITFERFLNAHNPLPPFEKELKFIDVNGIKIKEFRTTHEEVEKDYIEITQISKSSDYCDKMIEEDLCTIKLIFETISSLRDKRIAHLTSTKIEKVPTYKNVNENVEKLLNIIRKYNLLIFNVHETFDYCDLNVHTVFEKPWIKY